MTNNSEKYLEWLVVQFALQLLVVAHFTDCLHEIFLNNVLALRSVKQSKLLLKNWTFSCNNKLTGWRRGQLQCKHYANQLHWSYRKASQLPHSRFRRASQWDQRESWGSRGVLARSVMGFQSFDPGDLKSIFKLNTWDNLKNSDFTWSQQSWIQCIWTVGGHDHLDLAQRIETVHLIE